MNRMFSMPPPFCVPDGTLVSPSLNSKDSMSGLPVHLLDALSIAAGEIESGVSSKVHVMPLVTQVSLVLSGQLEVRMKDRLAKSPYSLRLDFWQAVVTKPGTFFQLHNEGPDTCRVLYIASPAYIFHKVNDTVEYEDSVVPDEGWDDLTRERWRPVK